MTLHVGIGKEIADALGYEAADGEVSAAVASRSTTLLATLREGRRRIEEFFGPEATARLSVKADPEIPGLESVVVEIFVPGSLENAMQCTDRFDFGWWLEASRREAAEICFLAFPR